MLNFGMNPDEVRQAAEAYEALLENLLPYANPFTTLNAKREQGRTYFDGELRDGIHDTLGRDLTEDELLQLVVGSYRVFGGSVRIDGRRFSGYIDSI